MNKRNWLLAIAAVVAVGGALLVGVAAQAQEAQAVPSDVDDLGAAELSEAPFGGPFGLREAPEGMLGGMLGAVHERMGRGGHGPGHMMGGGAHLEAVAEVLGLTVEELREELQSGKSLADIAEEQGVALEDLEDAILAKVKEHLDEAVADGRMDQERADEILAKLAEHIGELLTKEMPDGGDGPGRGGRGGRGGHGGFGEHRDCGEKLGESEPEGTA